MTDRTVIEEEGGVETEQASAAQAGTAGPKLDVRKEVRLALVMYGGVSLAIYMNGVAQELYHLVRATAPKHLRHGGDADGEVLVPPEELSGTEAVYRTLGQSLERLAENPNEHIADTKPGEEISTRFVIDILSGSSAGGINAVFLATVSYTHLTLPTIYSV